MTTTSKLYCDKTRSPGRGPWPWSLTVVPGRGPPASTSVESVVHEQMQVLSNNYVVEH